MFSNTEKIALTTPAKINLFLEVLGRRDNGYHDINSVILPISLFDRIELVCTDGETKTETVIGADLGLNDEPGVLFSGGNLATKAVEIFRRETGHSGGVIIRLEKNIPIGGGLGGGSADAAAVLIGLNQLWGSGLSRKELADIGARLGCDVPALVMGGPVHAYGLGDLVDNIPVKWDSGGQPWWLVLANPGFSVSTGDIYKRLSESLTSGGERYKKMVFALENLDIGLAGENLFNALEQTVVIKYPVIGILLEKLRHAGAVGVQVSGSGASVFGLVGDEAHARAVEAGLKQGVGFPIWSKVVKILPDGVMVAHGPLEARV